jgi:hypothetical protein
VLRTKQYVTFCFYPPPKSSVSWFMPRVRVRVRIISSSVQSSRFVFYDWDQSTFQGCCILFFIFSFCFKICSWVEAWMKSFSRWENVLGGQKTVCVCVDDSREIAEHCSFLNQVEPIEGRLISIDGGRYPMDLGWHLMDVLGWYLMC